MNSGSPAAPSEVPRVVPVRRRLPDDRQAITHKFDIQGHEGYITVGLDEDGMPGEIFIVLAKENSTASGFADAFAKSVSYNLQFGVPLPLLVESFTHVRFEPSGQTQNPDIRFAKSIVDYMFRWLELKFLHKPGPLLSEVPATGQQYPEAPPCATCGTVMAKTGAAWKCSNCGRTDPLEN